MKPCLASLSPSKSLSPRKGTGHLSPSGGGEIELPVIAAGHHVHRPPGGVEPGGAGHGDPENWGKEIVDQRIRFLHLAPETSHARNQKSAPMKSASYISKGVRYLYPQLPPWQEQERQAAVSGNSPPHSSHWNGTILTLTIPSFTYSRLTPSAHGVPK